MNPNGPRNFGRVSVLRPVLAALAFSMVSLIAVFACSKYYFGQLVDPYRQRLEGQLREKARSDAARIARRPVVEEEVLLLVPGAGAVLAARAAVVEEHEAWSRNEAAADLDRAKESRHEVVRRAMLEDLIRDWPKTPAAEEAAELLKAPR